MNHKDLAEITDILNKIIKEAARDEHLEDLMNIINLSARAEMHQRNVNLEISQEFENEINNAILKFKGNGLLKKK